MKLLLDEGLPYPCAELLRGRGYDAVHTSEVGLDATVDADIIAAARTDRRVIVTLDADFHAAVALSGDRRPSVIRIRIEGLRWEPLADLIAGVVDTNGEAIAAGALVSVREWGLRVRRLPIRSPT